MKKFITGEDVEKEIERLQKSEYVKLARKKEYVDNARRQYMYSLRAYEKKGKVLAEEGWTLEMLEGMEQ